MKNAVKGHASKNILTIEDIAGGDISDDEDEEGGNSSDEDEDDLVDDFDEDELLIKLQLITSFTNYYRSQD